MIQTFHNFSQFGHMIVNFSIVCNSIHRENHSRINLNKTIQNTLDAKQNHFQFSIKYYPSTHNGIILPVHQNLVMCNSRLLPNLLWLTWLRQPDYHWANNLVRKHTIRPQILYCISHSYSRENHYSYQQLCLLF